ncbi:MAG: TolC family protein [Gammaproteobacteria bacterium]|nr:TolC family protein [Gammaproteobacteria bacterium]
MFINLKKILSAPSLLLLLLPVGTLAQIDDSNNDLDPATKIYEVFDSVQMHYPLIMAARAEIRAKDSMLQAAQGAFDPVIGGSYKNRLSGFYDGNSLETMYKKRFPAFCASVFGGYSRSNGSFPTYENDLATTSDGETKIGVSVSLWRDRDIDEFRYGTARAEVDVLRERYNLQRDIISILQDAYITYAQWLQAEHLLGDYTELLEIAQNRAIAVERSVESGNAAEILGVDNELAVLQRRGLVVDAQRLVDASAYKLSVYLRNPDGSPKLPVFFEGLEMPRENIGDTSNMDSILDRVVELDPVIASTRLARQQEQLDVLLAENQGKPRVDLRFYNSKDFGSGITALRAGENVADISFSIPLATNAARGKASAARARMTGIDLRIRQFINQTRAELEIALVNVEATREMKDIAELELDAARQLAEAEARRFESGLSDFFQLNLSEQAVAQAELKRWQADFDHQVALANYYGVSMNLESLGIETGMPQ